MKTIPGKWLRLFDELAERASQTFDNAGCNDLDVPDGWTAEDVFDFNRAVEDWNSGGSDFDPEMADQMPPDFAAFGFLASLLVELAPRVEES